MEELSLQPVARRGGPVPGRAGVMAVLAVAALLAGGLGVLGGRVEPSSPAPTSAAIVVTPAAPVGQTAPQPTPAITPYTDCGPEPAEPPVISLQTNGVPTAGLVEVIDREAEPTPGGPAPADPLELLRGPHVAVRPDVITEIWIDGAACALRWFVGLYDPLTEEGFEIERAGMDEQLDARVAAQNRFNLSQAFAPHRALGHDLQLIGAFEFQDVGILARWRVAVQPLRLPTALLRDARTGRELELVPGCHLRLFLANGYQEDIEPCETDLSEAIGGTALIAPGETLSLEFDGLPAGDLTLTCGRLSGLDFVAEPAPGCREDVPDGGPIRVPNAPGTWTIAMSTCVNAGSGPASVVNTLCGTWYANVRIVEANRVE